MLLSTMRGRRATWDTLSQLLSLFVQRVPGVFFATTSPLVEVRVPFQVRSGAWRHLKSCRGTDLLPDDSLSQISPIHTDDAGRL